MITSWVAVRPFNELTSGVEMNEPILDKFQCPHLDLSNIIYLYPVSLVLTPVSIVHSCSMSCTFKTNRTRQIEHEEVQTDDFDFGVTGVIHCILLIFITSIHTCFLLKMINNKYCYQ